MTENVPQPPAKGNVLLVDDDKFLLNMYAMKFTQSGYVAHGCLSAADGLEVLRKGFAADAIVFDLIMPEHDGFSFLESLQSEKLGLEAVKIALTNQSDESDQNRARELGADLCLVKASMIPSEVVNTVTEAIAKKSSSK